MSVNQQVSALTAALRANFWKAWEDTAVVAPSDVFTSVLPSSTRIENYPNFTPAPAMQEWDGANDYGTISSYIYSIENKVYRASLMMRVYDLEDDQTGALQTKPKELAIKAKKLPHREVMKALASGQTGSFTDGTSYGAGFDGTYFFASSHNFGTGSNLMSAYNTVAYNGGTGDTTAYNLYFLYHGPGTETLKPMIWQQRSGPEFRTNAGTDQSDESLQVRSWATLRGRAAYGIWYNAVKQPINGKPNVSEMHEIFSNVEARFRTFQLPKFRAVTFGEYVHEQTQFSSSSLTIAGSTGLAEVLRQALTQDWAPQAGAAAIGGNTAVGNVATTNNYKGWAGYMVSNFL
jgi:phage major head subunit gpT-like protein